ncbi:MAG TPA: Gfo/Idh/MocA family oxidoreductase [Terriglobales bacterium]|nr:Gfo/Idh/MocA family oxidoreductase [Terriglobales bacterium]
MIGAGFTAREHIRALRDIAGVQVAAIHSRTRSRAEALAGEFGIKAVCDSVPELYERSGAALVFVTVPELSINAVAKASFGFPWTVVMEKPPGYNLADALDIQRAAEDRQCHVLVALNRRFLAATLRAKAELAETSAPRFIKVQDQQSQSAALSGGQPVEVVRNYMYANSIHTIDYLRVFGRGNITSVEPILRWDPDYPGVVVCRIAYDSGDVGLYEGIWHAPGPWAVTVTVPEKRWEMRPLERLTSQKLAHPPQSADSSLWDTNFKPGFRLQAEAAVASACGRPSPSVSLADAVETMRLIARIFA